MNFDVIVERKFRKAQEEGAFDKLKGAGQPLDLEENPFEDPEMRLSYRILKNAKMPPAWIVMGQDVDAFWDHCVYLRERHGERVRAAQAEIDRGSPRHAAGRLAELLERHRCFGVEQQKRIAELNRKIDHFNLVVPIQSLQKRNVAWRDEQARLDLLRPRP
ncbi:MAG: DUF1992 domain-containing protein [Chloroflexi bacterium]|nr:DUF1992 domain-containing protein [Chloroflexota bacterium]